MPRVAWTVILLSVLPHETGMTGMYHHTQPLIEMGSHELFAQLTSNCNPPDLCLQVANGLSHCTYLLFLRALWTLCF
jgi:hypothetical protein